MTLLLSIWNSSKLGYFTNTQKVAKLYKLCTLEDPLVLHSIFPGLIFFHVNEMWAS